MLNRFLTRFRPDANGPEQHTLPPDLPAPPALPAPPELPAPPDLPAPTAVQAAPTPPGAASVSVRPLLDDSPGWGSLTSSLGMNFMPHDYDPGKVQEIYADALEAWRKNPIAWRTIAVTTNYIVGDGLQISSPHKPLDRFIAAFWSHPKNQMSQRLDSMADELSRAGDLFVLLFRNPQDGMSYIRFITKDRITRIETAPNDWETELSYHELRSFPPSPPGRAAGGEGAGDEGQIWLSPDHPAAAGASAICLHYSINRPIGALLGESDLTTMLPWLLRYSRMLEDRVRLNWAMRSFLWFVTVPSARVPEKREQYRNPPEAGSIVVKDDSETWEPNAPLLRGNDAAKDLQAVRGMIDAGSGFPPHWRGDAGDISLATAQAMQGPTERHLRRRQTQFTWMLCDILYHAYQRAVEIGYQRPLPKTYSGYAELFDLVIPDISRWDNESLAKASRDISQALYTLSAQLGDLPPEYARLLLSTTFKFAGEPLAPAQIDTLIDALRRSPPAPPTGPACPTPGAAGDEQDLSSALETPLP